MEFDNACKNPDDTDDLYDLLKKVSTCPVCTDLLKDPKSLSCGHSFCSSCIEHVFHKSASSTHALCPLCRKKFFPEGQAVANLPRNHKLQEILDLLHNYKHRQMTLSDSVCGMCDSECEKIECVCMNHFMKMCHACTDKHNRLDKSKTCEVLPISKVQGTALMEIINEAEKSEKCPAHHTQQVNKFCETCDKLVCENCWKENCASHSLVSIDQTAASMKKKLNVNIDENAPKIVKLKNYLDTIESCNSQLESSTHDAQLKIKDTANDLRSWIDREEARCLHHVEETNDIKRKEIISLKETLEIQLVRLTSLQDHMTSLIQYGPPILLAKRWSSIERQIKDLQGNFQKDNDIPKEDSFYITFSKDNISSNIMELQIGSVEDMKNINLPGTCNLPKLELIDPATNSQDSAIICSTNSI